MTESMRLNLHDIKELFQKVADVGEVRIKLNLNATAFPIVEQ